MIRRHFEEKSKRLRIKRHSKEFSIKIVVPCKQRPTEIPKCLKLSINFQYCTSRMSNEEKYQVSITFSRLLMGQVLRTLNPENDSFGTYTFVLLFINRFRCRVSLSKLFRKSTFTFLHAVFLSGWICWWRNRADFKKIHKIVNSVSSDSGGCVECPKHRLSYAKWGQLTHLYPKTWLR